MQRLSTTDRQLATETPFSAAQHPRFPRFLETGIKRLLAGLVGGWPQRRDGAAFPTDDIAPAVPKSLLKAEIEALPPEQRLIASGQFVVQYARAAQMPWCLQEIGRLRELSFRAVGEGTGKTSDIDLFDSYYLHLFVWDAQAEAIVGAYRMGLADEILARYGKRGLYTQSLFKYGPRALRSLNPAIELGRSFVRAEYQRSFAPLLLLWRGIGRFIAQAPRYAVLFGPVSISASYEPLSRQMMVDYLKANNVETVLARHVKPRRPFRVRRPADSYSGEFAGLKDIEDLSRLIERIEHDHKGVPILLKQYLKLGGRLLGFSADAQFNHALDGLIMVDLRLSEPRVLTRYMGDEGAASFFAYHEAQRSRLRRAS
jgi:putative hemolysin